MSVRPPFAVRFPRLFSFLLTALALGGCTLILMNLYDEVTDKADLKLAVNAAIKVLSTAINTSLGVPLL